MNFQKSHKNVEDKNVFFQTPQVGDVVEAFDGRVFGVVVGEDFHHGKNEKVFCVANFNTNNNAMPFQSECKVMWKRNDNFNGCVVNEMNSFAKAKVVAQQFEMMVN